LVLSKDIRMKSGTKNYYQNNLIILDTIIDKSMFLKQIETEQAP